MKNDEFLEEAGSTFVHNRIPTAFQQLTNICAVLVHSTAKEELKNVGAFGLEIGQTSFDSQRGLRRQTGKAIQESALLQIADSSE